MSAIGILGGMGPQASAQLIDLLIEGTKAFTPAAVDSDFPEIVLLSVPVPNFISNKDNLEKAKQMLIEHTILLEKAGCIVNGIACNTAHQVLPELQAVTKVPFLSIPKLVATQVKPASFKRVGILATPSTLQSRLFDDAIQSAKIIRPNLAIAKKVETLIYKQLANRIASSDRIALRKIVSEFKNANNLDAVILGCTELPLIFGKSDSEVIDTLQLLADGLLKVYFKSSQRNL